MNRPLPAPWIFEGPTFTFLGHEVDLGLLRLLDLGFGLSGSRLNSRLRCASANSLAWALVVAVMLLVTLRRGEAGLDCFLAVVFCVFCSGDALVVVWGEEGGGAHVIECERVGRRASMDAFERRVDSEAPKLVSSLMLENSTHELVLESKRLSTWVLHLVRLLFSDALLMLRGGFACAFQSVRLLSVALVMLVVTFEANLESWVMGLDLLIHLGISSGHPHGRSQCCR